MSKFSDRLFHERKSHTLTQEGLCKILEEKYGYTTNKGMISKYEKGIHEPNVDFLNYVSEIFGVNLNYMIGRSDDKYGEEIKYRQIPILGTIACGIPITAQEDILGYEYILPNDKCDFCLRAKGNSMINARIYNGDIVYIVQQPTVENGEIAAVLIDDEATLKRVYIVDGVIILRAENPDYKDIVISKKDKKNVCILGKAVFFKSEVR